MSDEHDTEELILPNIEEAEQHQRKAAIDDGRQAWHGDITFIVATLGLNSVYGGTLQGEAAVKFREALQRLCKAAGITLEKEEQPRVIPATSIPSDKKGFPN